MYYNPLFGVRGSRYTVKKLKVILGFYGLPRRRGDNKGDMLNALRNLELSSQEQERIRNFVSGDVQTLETAPAEQEPKRRKIEHNEDSTTECYICAEELAMESFLTDNLVATCAHELNFCKSCITMSVDTQIQEVAWDEIRCPMCPEKLDFGTIKLYASPDAFERYDRLSVMSVFRDMPNFTMCLGPGCDSGQIHGGGDDQPIMTCTTCKFKTCFTHKMPWHSGRTCAEYDTEQTERAEQEAATEKLLNETSKVCPNPKCGVHITKTGGCDHMTCRSCRHEFCWVCFAAYDEIRVKGNSVHEDTCMYHTQNLPGRQNFPNLFQLFQGVAE